MCNNRARGVQFTSQYNYRLVKNVLLCVCASSVGVCGVGVLRSIAVHESVIHGQASHPDIRLLA